MLSGVGKKFLTRIARANSAGPTRGYHQIIVDHYENPRNVGSLDKSKMNVGTGLLSPNHLFLFEVMIVDS